MLDVIMALGDKILFCIQYILHVCTHKKLIMDYTINDWNSCSSNLMYPIYKVDE